VDDITPLNLEDQPKLFGLRYDQLIAILAGLIGASQLYSWLNPIPFFGHDLRTIIALFIFGLGPLYALITMNDSGNKWEQVVNFYVSSSVYIPGPDPNPTRFLVDETLVAFNE
jgi:hypothetical protein